MLGGRDQRPVGVCEVVIILKLRLMTDLGILKAADCCLTGVGGRGGGVVKDFSFLGTEIYLTDKDVPKNPINLV